MRLKEPFRGLYLVGGHSIFHFALLVVSLTILGFPEEETKENEEYLYTINYLRVAHGIDLLFAILKLLGSTPKSYAKHCFTFKIMDTFKMIVYTGSIIFAIFHETHTIDGISNKDFWISHSEVFILLELLVFFGQILCSTIFLFIVQMQGECGVVNDVNN